MENGDKRFLPIFVFLPPLIWDLIVNPAFVIALKITVQRKRRKCIKVEMESPKKTKTKRCAETIRFVYAFRDDRFFLNLWRNCESKICKRRRQRDEELLTGREQQKYKVASADGGKLRGIY